MKKYFLEMDLLISMRTGVRQILDNDGGNYDCKINGDKIVFGFDKSEQMTKVSNQLTNFGVKTKVLWGGYGNKK